MTRREAALSIAGVVAVALAVRIVASLQVRYPVPEDTAYYVDVAGNLVRGRGLVIDALWSFITPPLALPRDAFEVWLPLPSFIAAVPMAIFGPSFGSAQVAAVALGSVLPVLAWRLAADVAEELSLPPGRARTLAIGTGLVAAVVPALVVYSVLPDSTVPFAVLTLAACLLMTRIVRAAEADVGPPSATSDGADRSASEEAAPGVEDGVVGHGRGGRFDRRLPLLGLVLGLAALCRSEVVWLALAWLVVAWPVRRSRRDRLVMIAVPAAVAGLVFVPWAIRDLVVFGQPLPGQTIANAFSISPLDIYAYLDPPTLSRYLSQGPGSLVDMRISGTLHNLINVLVLPAVPTGLIGVLALPLVFRLRTLRPLLLTAAFSFLAASLIFPVATTWGTFLHGSLAIDVLLIVATLVALDRLIAAIGRFRGWTRPVAWLGPALAVAVALPLLNVSVSSIARSSSDTADRYGALASVLAAAGAPLTGAPVITDHPIWLARAMGVPAIALPDESPDAVLQLARRFGARLVVVQDDGTRKWPGILRDGTDGASCFVEVSLPRADSLATVPTRSASSPPAALPADTSEGLSAASGVGGPALAQTRVFRVVCA